MTELTYLKNSIWQSKPKLPIDRNNFPLVETPNTEIIYDFEAQHNIYSISAFYEQENKLIIWYKTDTSLHIDEEKVLKKAYEINGLTLDAYKDQLGPVKLEVHELTFDALRQIFENPKRYVVGFNSNFYDLPLAAYILASGYHRKGRPDLLIEPSAVRKFSNLLIDPVGYMKQGGESEFGEALKANRIHLGGKNRRLSIWDLNKIYGTQRDANAINYNPVANTAPGLFDVFRRLNNTGLHLDMKRLNEKDKDMETMYTSLKRIAAQLGYQIEEPELVDLSSNEGLNDEQATNLLAYNASDVLVTTLIYHTKAYQDVLVTHEGLLNRFDESNFHGKLNINSTSAQFVERVIAPDTKLKDQEKIELFYPIHDKNYEDVQKQIDAEFINKDVPYLDKSTGYVQTEFNKWVENQPEYQEEIKPFSDEYNKTIEIAQDALKQTGNEQNYQAMVNQATSRANRELFDIRQKLMKNVDVWTRFAKTYAIQHNNGNLDRDTLDMIWTAKLQKDPRFAPKKGRDGEVHQRFRVKYGEIQEDLLEHMANTYKKFPDEVYTMYSMFRNTESEYDYRGNLVKTGRQIAVENYVKKYSLGYEPLTSGQKAKGQDPKPIPPRNVYYKFKQGSTQVTGVGVIVQVPDQPMCLSFSVGGVHGEVMNADMYQRDLHIADKYNNTLKYIQEAYPDAKDFYEAAVNDNLEPQIGALLKLDEPDFKKDLNLFITKKKSGIVTYKKAKKQINPKDYVIPIDMHNAVHVDVDSLYPSLMINLHLFSTWTDEYNDPAKFNETNKSGHWDDVYAKLRAERVSLKKAAEAVPKEDWGPVQYHQWDIQKINKLLLNSASGIADGSNDTNVRVNNKASSMRIMGQLALTYLVYSVEPDGVYSTSTNTDGVYLTSDKKGFTEKDIDDKIEAWKYYFHLGATPEIMAHFVSKDANNRFERQNYEEPGTPAGGTIGNAFGASSSKKMSQPFIIDAGIVNYFNTHSNVCKTYDIPMEDLKDYLRQQQAIIVGATEYTDEVREAMLSFCWPIQPSKHQHYCLANKQVDATEFLSMQHVNRIVLTKHGYYLRGYKLNPNGKKAYDKNLTNWCVKTGQIAQTSMQTAAKVKVTNFDPSWHVVRLNQDLAAYFNSPVWRDLDIDAYANFTRDRILGDEGSRIWVEESFKLPNYTAKLNNLVKDV